MEYTDDELWSCIEAVRWPEVCREQSPTRIQRYWKECGFRRSMLFAASRFAEERYGELMERVNEFEKVSGHRCGDYGGDDSFSDMLWHVVGSGRGLWGAIGSGRVGFDTIMADPTKLDGFKFTESFSYILFRESDDWDQFEIYHHHASIMRALGGISYMRHKYGRKMPAEAKEVTKELERRFFLILDKGDLKGACGDFADHKTYDRFCNFEGNTESAMFANVLSDIYECLC